MLTQQNVENVEMALKICPVNHEKDTGKHIFS